MIALVVVIAVAAIVGGFMLYEEIQYWHGENKRRWS